MIVELNGISYSLDVALDPSGATRHVRIVDEAYVFEELRAEADSQSAVLHILEAYSGMQLDTSQQYELLTQMP